MKIRTDFVSNSSSSSFVLFGKVFDLDDVKKIAKKRGIYDSVLKDYEDAGEDVDEDEIDDYTVLEKIIGDADLQFEIEGEYCDGNSVVVGIYPDRLVDDLTVKQNREELSKTLNNFGFKCTPDEIEFVSGGSTIDGYTFIGSNG